MSSKKPFGSQFVTYEHSGAVSIRLKEYLRTEHGKATLRAAKKLGSKSFNAPVEMGRVRVKY